MSTRPRAGFVVTTQATPDVWQFENEWSKTPWDCCQNCKECAYATFCFPCYTCNLFRRSGEMFCTPICTPMSLMALRTKVRTGFRIRGSVCGDCAITSFCPICSAIQISNELSFQGL